MECKIKINFVLQVYRYQYQNFNFILYDIDIGYKIYCFEFFCLLFEKVISGIYSYYSKERQRERKGSSNDGWYFVVFFK